MMQYCTFTLGELHFGIETHQVQEVLRSTELTRVPLAPPSIRGLMNLRGQIVTVIDLAERLGLARLGAAPSSVHVVVMADGAAVSLLVDAVGDVVEVTQAGFEYPPDTLEDWLRELIVGVHKLEDRLLLVLDVARAVDLAGTATGRAR